MLAKRKGGRTYDYEVKTVLLCVERRDCAHFVRFETLRVGARVVQFDHARADIYTYEARNVRRQSTRYLS